MYKRLFLGTLLVGLLSTSALAWDPMGPPAATIDKGAWGIGIESSYTDVEIERLPNSWSDASRTVDIEMWKVFAKLVYGVSENVTGFVRVGVASMDWGPITGSHREPEGEGDWRPAWGGGFAATLSESGDTTWGCILQVSEARLAGDEDALPDEDYGNFNIKLTEIQFAVGPTWRASDTVRFYGGPFVGFNRGTWEDSIDGDDPRKPIEEEAFWGAYLGTAIEMGKNAHLNIEGMASAEGWAVAGGVVWRCK
jgi:hypothetical protein